MGKIAQEITLKSLSDFLQNQSNSLEFNLKLGQGLVKGFRPLKFTGRNSDIDDVTEDLWELGGTYVYPAAGGIQMSIQSSNANDTDGGTGARSVEIHYLDNLYIERDEEIVMNGVGAVLTTATNILRINGMHVISVGSNGYAVGNVAVTNVAQTVTYMRISAQSNTHRQAIFTIPLNKSLLIFGWGTGSGTAAGTRYTSFTMNATAHDDEGTIEYQSGIFYIWDETASQDNDIFKIYSLPIYLPEKTDLKISAVSDSVVASATCTTLIDSILIDNEILNGD
jgi:hypothetical protein